MAGVVPKGEQFNHNEILISGAFKVLEIIGKNQWKREGQSDVPLRLLPTTFDPSACVLDDGLMIELERLNKGEEQHPAGKALEGMTLQTVAEMMCQPNNGLVIRDRWWNCESDWSVRTTLTWPVNVHEDSFTGEQFTEWLLNTFSDIKTVDEAADWGRSLFDKGLIGEEWHMRHGQVVTVLIDRARHCCAWFLQLRPLLLPPAPRVRPQQEQTQASRQGLVRRETDRRSPRPSRASCCNVEFPVGHGTVGQTGRRSERQAQAKDQDESECDHRPRPFAEERPSRSGRLARGYHPQCPHRVSTVLSILTMSSC